MNRTFNLNKSYVKYKRDVKIVFDRSTAVID